MKESESGLKVAEIIPIVRGIQKQTLTYFTKSNLPIGAFVKVPLRNKNILGIVTNITTAESSKINLKTSSFPLRKLASKEDARLSPAFIRAAEKTAEYYACSIGSILGAVIPAPLLENPSLISSSVKEVPSDIDHTREPLIVQLGDTERYLEYKSLIRESFARHKSVLFCVPAHEEGLRAADILSKGIEPYVYCTAGKSPKLFEQTLIDAHKDPHPILFITTPSGVSFDRTDLETIILERENSRSYQTLSRPYINVKVFLEFLAKESGQTLVMGDSILSLETLYKEKQGVYAELSPLKWRLGKNASSMLVDMKAPRKVTGENKDKEFQIFSAELKAMIRKALDEKRKIFLFGVRKGLSPSTMCKDCGTILACENCKAPVVLHKFSGKETFYLCHACGAKRPSQTRCDKCDSWNLVPLGIGVDKIAETVEALFPEAVITILDKDHASTPTKARTLAKRFAGQKGGIVIGTELAFLYLEKIPYVGLVSLDSLFSIPDFGIHERIFYLVTRLLEICDREAIIQTRNIGRTILEYAERGNILDFYRAEIEERRELFYPPFSVFIKVTTEGSTGELRTKAGYLQTLFEDEQPVFVSGRGLKSGALRLSMVLRLLRDNWPDEAVREKLLLLPPDFLIKVDPESIL